MTHLLPSILPCTLALAWQLSAGLRLGSWGPWRLGALGLAIALLVLESSGKGVGSRKTPVHLLAALGVPFLFWVSVLEAWVTWHLVLALGLTALACVAWIHVAYLIGRAGEPSQRLRRRWGVRFAIMAAATLFTVASVESAMSLTHSVHTYPLMPEDPKVPAGLFRNAAGRPRGVPGFRGVYVHPEFAGVRVEINALGLRDGSSEIQSPGAEDVSVLVLGDSFMFGMGVALQETLQEQLEEGLRHALGPRVRVYNGGIPGYGVVQELEALDELAGIVRPDVVLLGIFEGNDFQDTFSARRNGDRGALIERAEPPQGDLSLLGSAGPTGLERARQFSRWVLTREYWVGSSLLLQALVRGGSANQILAGSVRANRFLNEALQEETSSELLEWESVLLAELETLRHRCDELEAELVLVVIPDRGQADPERFEAYAERYLGGLGPHLSRTGFHSQFVHNLGAAGFRAVDLLADLEAKFQSGRPPYYREGHWNSTGNAVGAARTTPVLVELLRPLLEERRVPGSPSAN